MTAVVAAAAALIYLLQQQQAAEVCSSSGSNSSRKTPPVADMRPLGASLANPKRPESFWRTKCNRRISSHTNMDLVLYVIQECETSSFLCNFDQDFFIT